MSVVTLNILTFADYVLIPATMDAFAVSNIKYVIEHIKVIEDFYDKAPQVLGIVPTMYDKRISISSQALEAVKKLFGEKYPVFSPIGIDATVKKAQTRRKFIYEFPNSRAAAQYKELTDVVLERI